MNANNKPLPTEKKDIWLYILNVLCNTKIEVRNSYGYPKAHSNPYLILRATMKQMWQHYAILKQ